MSGNTHTPIRSRQAAAELRTLREQAGLSGAEVAKRLGMSPSKISRIETGNSGLQIENVAALLGPVPGARVHPRTSCSTWCAAPMEHCWLTRQPGLPQL